MQYLPKVQLKTVNSTIISSLKYHQITYYASAWAF